MKKNVFSNDWVLKIISFIGAVLLWMYIIIVVDPPIDVTVRDIPIQYTEQGKLASEGLSVVGNRDNTLEIKIRGSRKKLANIDKNLISATVDLSTVTSVGTHSVPVNVTIPFEYSEIVSKKPLSVDVTIDKIVEIRKDVTVVAKDLPENNYMAGDIKVTPSSVLLKGPESVIKQISSVAAFLTFDGTSEDVYTKNKVELLDNKNNIVSDESDIAELVISDVELVDIYCPIYKMKTVSVVPKSIGNIPKLENGNDVKIEVIPAAVTIYGKAEQIENINEIKTELFSASELNVGDELTVKLNADEKIAGICDDIDSVTIRITGK